MKGRDWVSEEEWVVKHEEGLTRIENRGGVDWFEAPPHRRFTPHRAQTRAWTHHGYIERCSCGGMGPAPWTHTWQSTRTRAGRPNRVVIAALCVGLWLVFAAVALTVSAVTHASDVQGGGIALAFGGVGLVLVETIYQKATA